VAAPGGNLTKTIETNQVWLGLQQIGIETEEWNKIGEKHGIKLDDPRPVLHHQIGNDAVGRLRKVFDEAFHNSNAGSR
jgi:threonine aldolase